MYYYVKAWLGYLDITFSDMLLFLVLGMLIAFGIYIMIKKNVMHGFAQIILTLFSPLLVCSFIANNRDPSGSQQIKMWLKMFESNYGINTALIVIMMIIMIPLWIFVTIKNVTLLKKK